ncbi:MAG: DUF3536 domain-containing protein [Bacteroidia bacterium]
MTKQQFICIHGHFYQPPREHAWLEEIEIQDSAYPYHDWNERITAECYGPNAVSRILDGNNRICDIVNNYTRISFNFGPTLLSWMEKYAQEVYQAILEADRQSIARFGHGSAIAQVYNHIIMPLASRADKETQVIWGIRDFEMRFGRKPEGMWLAETAADVESLEVLAEQGIRFTVMAPRQLKAVRKLGESDWHEVAEPQVDSLQHYLCKLPSGKEIILFFYNGLVAQKVAFEGLLKDGKAFAEALLAAFDPHREQSQLVHIATDGESYGHHHRHGEMALSYCLKYIEDNELATLTNYATYAATVVPEFEVQIHNNSSWSCVHGVERWRSDCGCNSGGYPQYNQAWRVGLREALNWLRDELNAEYQSQMHIFCADVWGIRNAYIEVINDRSEANVSAFLERFLYFDVEEARKTKVLRLLEMMRQCQLMFTSCAWFFDEISGIETVQVLQYACRAIQIAETESNLRLDDAFQQRLSIAISNVPHMQNGAHIYESITKASRLSLTKVGMHFVANALFSEIQDDVFTNTFRFESDFFERFKAGVHKLAIGRTKVVSKITHSEKRFSFAVIYLGQHHLIGNANDQMDEQTFMKMYHAIRTAFESSNLAEVIHVIQQYFGEEKFSFWQLFRDQQKKVLKVLVEREIAEAERALKQVYDRNYNLMSVMKQVNIPMPLVFRKNLELVVNNQLRVYFQQANPKAAELQRLVEEIRKWQVPLEGQMISYVASQRLYELLSDFVEEPDRLPDFINLHQIMQQLGELDVKLDLWQMQNLFFQLASSLYPGWQANASENDARALEFIWFFRLLAGRLNISLERFEIAVEQ